MCYADETSIFLQGTNLIRLNVTANEVIIEVGNWLHNNKMFLNARKTKYLVFQTVNSSPNCENLYIKFHQSKLNRTERVRETSGSICCLLFNLKNLY